MDFLYEGCCHRMPIVFFYSMLVAHGKGICAITILCRSIQLFVLLLINMGYEHLWRDLFSV